MKNTYSTSEAADKIGVALRTITRWLADGKIKPSVAVPMGGGRTLWRWSEADIAKARKIDRTPGPKPLGRCEMKAAIYARVSTVNNGQSPEMQLRDLREYCVRRGWQIAGEYVDVGISGAKDRRPQLDRMMDAAHKCRFDVVAVWKFDRFARSVSHLLRALDTFRVLGIELVSLSESLDTATPAGRMVFTVLGAVAELERSLIAERVRAGLRNARATGKRLGRPRKSVDARRIAKLRVQGRSVRQIASELGYTRSLVHKTLANGAAFRGANAAD